MMNSVFSDSSTVFLANDIVSAEAEQFSTSEKSDGRDGFAVGLCMGQWRIKGVLGPGQ